MAHFAELDENNVVLRVIVVDNKDTSDENGVEKEEIGITFCENLLGGRWKQTSYNGNMRKRYACAGDSYNEQLDAFIPKKPYDSWIFNHTTVDWEAPVLYPDDGKQYYWNENTLSWVDEIIPVDD